MARVVVTGGSGFVAGWCIAQLLDAGHDVVATVRSSQREAGVRAALVPWAWAHDRLSFAVADLGADEGWDQAMAGSEFVLHVASPLGSGPDGEEGLLAAAHDGTVRVLAAAARAGTRRVVLTSSCAAATPPSAQLDGTVDETCWTDADELGLAAYRRSKVIAERAAWDFVGAHDGSPELATILPAAVFGPALSTDSMSSLDMIARLLDGAVPAVPHLGLEVVDVRDVAAAHLAAMVAPAAAGERFIVAGDLLWYDEIAVLLRDRLGAAAAKVPVATIPDDVMRRLAGADPQLASIVPLVGRSLVHSSAKARRVLGWSARPAVDVVIDSARSILDLRGEPV